MMPQRAHDDAPRSRRIHHRHPLSRTWTTGAVLLGAGQGERLGHGPKALIELGGKPLLLHAFHAVTANRTVSTVVVTAPQGMVEEFEEIVASAHPTVPVLVVPGGLTRQASAHAGVQALPSELDWVAVTDVARPFAQPGHIDRLLNHLRTASQTALAARRPCGIAPVLPLADSVHLIAEEPLLTAPFDRNLLRAAQTPQVVYRPCLTACHEAAQRDGLTFTDEAGLVSRHGATVIAAPGDAANFKITFEYDLALAEIVLTHARTARRKERSAA